MNSLHMESNPPAGDVSPRVRGLRLVSPGPLGLASLPPALLRLLVLAVVVLGTGRVVFASLAVNAMCPVMTEEKVDPKFTTVYKGRTVGFCCDRCLAKFKANPQRYVKNLPPVAEASAGLVSGSDGHGSHAHGDSSDHAGAEDGAESHAEHADGDAPSGAAASGALHSHGAPADDDDGDDDDDREPWLGRVHPVLVHFPIAGPPLALLGFLLWQVTGREGFAKADVGPLLVSTLVSIASVITGNIAHDAMRFSESMHVIVERHQFLATSVMVLLLVLSVLRIWRWNRLTGQWRWIYGGGLALGCVLLGVTGYLGGSLVFGPDHLKLF